MPYEPERIGHVDVYYHALALYAANWTAYVVMMALLLGTGVALSLLGSAAPDPRIWGAAAASAIAYGGALYFISRIATYGEMLCEAVLAEYLARTHKYTHAQLTRICWILALICFAGNVYLVWDLAGLPPIGNLVTALVLQVTR